MLATAARALGAEPLGAIAGTRESDYVDPLTGRRYFVAFTPVGFEGWLVATVIPASDFLAEIDRATERLAWVLALLVLAAAAGSAWLANRLVARPIERIGGQLRHIEQFQLDRIEHVPSPLREIAGLSTTLVQMGRGLSSFRKFLPADLVRMLVSQGIEARPGGQRQNLTVMFADLAGFTRLSERLGDRIVPLLADYLGRMSREVANGGGTVDKFIGDAVMAFWGAPLANPAHAVDACRTALACQRMMTDLSSGGLGPHGSELSMRIGLNSGDVIVGNIGSDDRLNYTAVGDAVNLASRLESLNKRYGTGIIIGEATRRAAGDAIIVRHLDVVTVYGRSVGTPVYELLAMADEPVDLCIYAWRKTYERGLVAYRGRRWLEAIGFFEAVIAARGEDRPSMLFIERCQAFAMDPPPARWDAVTVLDAK
jgi:adenylate cyclase